MVRELDTSFLPPSINQCFQSFPFGPLNVDAESVQATIISRLPSEERALQLCDIFHNSLSWMFDILARTKVVNEVIPIIYKKVPGRLGPPELSLLLIILAIGCLVDMDLPPYSLEAQHYYYLARAALALQPVLGQQSLTTVKVLPPVPFSTRAVSHSKTNKVLHLMSAYTGTSGRESHLEESYALLDLASQSALKVSFMEHCGQLHADGLPCVQTGLREQEFNLDWAIELTVP